MIRKSLTIRGQWHYSLNDFDQMVQTLRATGPKLDLLISHRFGLSQVQDALALSATHETGKILLDPWK
jgi:VCBS repeat-containing protein